MRRFEGVIYTKPQTINVLCSREKGRNHNDWSQKYNSLYSSWSQNLCGVSDWQMGCGDEWRLPQWPITSSLGHNMLCCLQGPTWYFFCFSSGRYSTGGPLWATLRDAVLMGRPVSCWRSRDRSLLAASWDSETDSLTAHISLRHLYISFHNTHTFPLKIMTASAYFHRCVLCGEFLIDVLVKSQYATNEFKWILAYVKRCKYVNSTIFYLSIFKSKSGEYQWRK